MHNEKEKKYRQEASRKVSMANKRLKRMEEQNLSMSPAYQKFIDEGGQKFGIKGKSNDEVKAEVARLNKFLKQTTSTVRGTKKYLTNIANQVGIKDFDSFQSLNSQLKDFFEVADKVKEYLKNSQEISVSIGYKKIWEQVNEYAESVIKKAHKTGKVSKNPLYGFFEKDHHPNSIVRKRIYILFYAMIVTSSDIF